MRQFSGKALLTPRIVEICWYITAALAWGGLILSLPGYYLTFIEIPIRQQFNGLEFGTMVAGGVISLISSLVSLSLGTFLFLRKPGDRAALFVSFYLLLFGLVMAGPLELLEYLVNEQSALLFVRLQFAFFSVPAVILLLIFPNGVIIPSRFRWFIPISLVITAAFYLIPISELFPVASLSSKLIYGTYISIVILGFGAQIYRYLKVSTPVERQQTKIVIYGLILQFILMSISSIKWMQQMPFNERPTTIWDIISPLLWWISILILPVALTLAVIRSHLWEIDVIIRRTLVYGFLTVSLAVVYFSSVIIFQNIFLVIAGHESPLAVVLSTLAIAGLFHPLRRGSQAVIDRRFFRSKYNSVQALNRFQQSLRDRSDLDQIELELTGIIHATVQPEWTVFWVRKSTENK